MVELLKELNRLNLEGKKLTIGDKYIWRPISHLVLVPFIFLGIRNPNIITLISVVSLLIGVWVQEYWILYFMIWAVLDCADGSLARYNKQKRLAYGNGELVDAVGGYMFIVTFWYKIFVVYHYDLAILALIMNLMARLVFLKYTLTYNNTSSAIQMTRNNILYLIYENIEFGSLMLFIFLLAQYTYLTYIFVVSYTMISILLFLYAIFQSFRDINKRYDL